MRRDSRRRPARWLALSLLGLFGAAPRAEAQQSAAPGRPAAGATPKAPAAKPAAAPAAAAPKADPARMKKLLGLWEQRSSQLKTLDVQIKRLDESKSWGDEAYEGRAVLKSPDLAYLDFKKKDAGGKFKPDERIVCTGTEVYQYKPDTKQIFVFPLEKKDQHRALEEGPLPFLFNMKADEAERRYVMTLIDETKNAFVISIDPRLKLDKEAFSRAFVRLRKENYLPDRIQLVSPNGKDTKDYRLENLQPNVAVSDEFFKGVIYKNWQVVRDAAGVAPPQRAGAAAAAAPAARTGAAPDRGGVPKARN